MHVTIIYSTLDNLYIGDNYNNRVRKVTPSTSIISTIAGTGTAGYSGDNGLATSAKLNYPTGVAVDTSGSYLNFSINLSVSVTTKTTTR